MSRCAKCIHKNVCNSCRLEAEHLHGDCPDYLTADVAPKSEVAREIFQELRNILADDSLDSEETMAYDEQAAAYYEAELCRVVEQIKQLEKKYTEV